MTILRTNKYNSYGAASGPAAADQTVANLVEDPIGDLLFIQNDGFVSSTLASTFSKNINYRVSGGSGYASFGLSEMQLVLDPGFLGGVFFLNGETTHVKQMAALPAGSVNDYRLNLDLSPFWSMDPTRPIKGGYKYDSSGNNNCLFLTYKRVSPTAASNATRYLRRVNKTGDLSTSWADQNSADTSANIATSAFFTPIWRNPVTNNLVCFGEYVVSGYNPGAYTGYSLTGAFSNAVPTLQSAGGAANKSIQFVGVSSVTGHAIFMHNDTNYDYNQIFYRYNDSSNVSTALITYSVAPSKQGVGGAGTTGITAINTGTYLLSNRHETNTGAAPGTAQFMTSSGNGSGTFWGYIVGKVLTVTSGTSGVIYQGQTISGTGVIGGTTITATGTNVTTSIGGNRAASFGNYVPKYASRTFTDTNITSTIGFYVPYIDTAGNYQPFYYQWNTATDNFVQNQDITVTYPGANSFISYWTHDTVSGSSVGTTYGSQRALINEVFTYSGNGNKYLSLLQPHGGAPYETIPGSRTMITYSLSSDYKTLTYHSSVVFPQTPKNIVWLNDARTILGIICTTAFYIYNFNSASTGWNLVNTQPYAFNVVGRDSRGRIWAQDTYNGLGRLHIIAADSGIPSTLSVVSSATMYNYTGTNQSTALAVNAYDYLGNRTTASVTLTVSGSSLRLLDLSGSQVTTFTTSTTATFDTVVSAVVVGPGSSSLSATVNL
jgi:hypothetical protein